MQIFAGIPFITLYNLRRTFRVQLVNVHSVPAIISFRLNLFGLIGKTYKTWSRLVELFHQFFVSENLWMLFLWATLPDFPLCVQCSSGWAIENIWMKNLNFLRLQAWQLEGGRGALNATFESEWWNQKPLLKTQYFNQRIVLTNTSVTYMGLFKYCISISTLPPSYLICKKIQISFERLLKSNKNFWYFLP